MFRTPPGATKEDDSAYIICQTCHLAEDKPIVCCDQCNTWFHFTCVNAPEDVAEKEWFCPNCKAKNESQNLVTEEPAHIPTLPTQVITQRPVVQQTTSGTLAQDQNQPIHMRSQDIETAESKRINNTRRSHKTKSSVTSSHARKQLALQRLEEERQFELQERDRRERFNKEYLDKKYELLEQEIESDAADDDLSFDDEELNPSRYEKVGQWIEEVGNQRKSAMDAGMLNPPDHFNPQPYKETGKVDVLSGKALIKPIFESSTTANEADKNLRTEEELRRKQLSANKQFGYQNDEPDTKSLGNPTINRELISTARGASNIREWSQQDLRQQYVGNQEPRPSNNQQGHELTDLQEISRRYEDVNQIRRKYGFGSIQITETIGNSRQLYEPITGREEFPRQLLHQEGNPTKLGKLTQQQSQPLNDNNQTYDNRHSHMKIQPQEVFNQTFAQPSQYIPIGQQQRANIPTATSLIIDRPVMTTSIYQPIQRSQIPTTLKYEYPPVPSNYYREPISSHYNHQPIYSSYNNQPLHLNPEGEIHNNRNPINLRDPAVSQPYMPSLLNTSQNDNIGVARAEEQGDVMTIANIMSRQVVDRTLQVFTGNPLEWNAWYNRYESTTNKCRLDNSENLARLVKCLKGKAEKIVKSKLGQTEAVPWIIQTLKKVFGRPETILKAALDQISKLPPLKGDDLTAIMEFALEAQSIRTAIDAPGMPNEYANPMILKDLVAKLPAQLQLEWSRDMRRLPFVTVRNFTDWLDTLADDISKVVEPTIDPPTKKKIEKSNDTAKSYVNVHMEGGHKSKQSTSATDNKKSPACSMCGKGCPKLENCPMFTTLTLDRKWKEIKVHKLCRLCLKKHPFPCKLSKVCGKDGCSMKHHPLLHDVDKGVPPNLSPTMTSNNVHQVISEQVMLKYVPIVIHKNNKRISTFLFFDDGTQLSMVEQELADKVGAQGTEEELCLMWTKDIHRKEKAQRISLEISGEENLNNRFTLNGIRTVSDLHLPAQTFIKEDFVKRYPHLADIPIRDYKDAVPGIIIGSDFPKLGVQLKVVEGTEFKGPIAQKTRLGWTIYGPTSDTTDVKYANNHHVVQICPQHSEMDQEVHQQIKEHFSIENFGVRANTSTEVDTKENQRAIEILQKLTKKVGDRYETGLLWKREDINKNLPDSYPMAMKRLISLENQGNDMVKKIGEKIQEYVDKGYVRKLSETEVNQLGNNVWYLPVFGVIHPKKPDKLRMVFDGAAKAKSVSLNSMLLTGPDELASLIDILRRFRENRFAVGGDIKEMYHQIKIINEDRRYQLFLFRNGENKRKPDVYIIDVMTFGSKCSPSSAQFVKNRHAKQYEVTHPRAVESIVKNHYVDDMMDGENTIEETVKMVQDVKKIHAEGGFEIRNFISNSPEVLKAIGSTDIRENKELTLNSELKTERVLGMWWNTKLDVFTFSLKYTAIAERILNGTRLPTKRELLRVLMSIFDPLGLLSNYMIQLKTLLQDVWRADLNWDEQISAKSLIERWKQWLNHLPAVETIQIPRLYSLRLVSETTKSIEIHTFVDASNDAFAAVTYLRIITSEGIDCALMGSKSRVAPLKYLSIPRKELQAAVLGTRLTISIKNAQKFKFDRRIFWSDSETVLSWLKSDNKKYNQFVAHRVGEILEDTDVNEWRWISTKENVADEATKWAKSGVNFQSSNRWFRGPEFLRKMENMWPKKKEIKADVIEEMKAHCLHASLSLPQLVNTKRFSKWNRMLRAVAYLIRFRNVIIDKRYKGKPLQQEELAAAETHIFRQAQFEGFPAEMVTLKRNESLPINKRKFIEKPSQLHDGSPYLDGNGVMRMRGRIDGARDLSMDSKRPIVLPKDSRITRLLVQSYHERFFHQNHNTVINEIRQRFYIPKSRALLKSVRNDCQMCKVRLAKATAPQMADLPQARMATFEKPFSYVGVDYFGPMKVKIGRRTEKRWGVLFTCLTIRAVHIEIVSSLNADSCIKAIRNFIADRGEVIEFHSDCGTHFTGAVSELEREMKKLDWDKLEAEFTSSFTKWNFNPPAAPHMGGSWERLIRSVKSGLYSALPTRNPSEETF